MLQSLLPRGFCDAGNPRVWKPMHSGRLCLTPSMPLQVGMTGRAAGPLSSSRSSSSIAEASRGASSGEGVLSAEQGEQMPIWEITEEKWCKYNFTDADVERFRRERDVFRRDPRLDPATLPGRDTEPPGSWISKDPRSAFQGFISVIRLSDLFTGELKEMLVNRLAEHPELMEHFGIPPLEDVDSVKPLHSKAVPTQGAYLKVRMQVYWLALHVWFLHAKQYIVQDGEGVLGSLLCGLTTTRLFSWQWNQVRGWMHDADVPAMSLSGELRDMQEYVFGFCVALDDAFKEEAPDGTRAALALPEESLGQGSHGLAPRVKHALWANVYSGLVPHDHPGLYELTAYTLQQRAALEAVPRGAFFARTFDWADFHFPSAGK